MDLIVALGAAPPHPSAKDREAPEQKSGGERDEPRKGFDDAMDSAAPQPAKTTNAPDKPAERKEPGATKTVLLFGEEDAPPAPEADVLEAMLVAEVADAILPSSGDATPTQESGDAAKVQPAVEEGAFTAALLIAAQAASSQPEVSGDDAVREARAGQAANTIEVLAATAAKSTAVAGQGVGRIVGKPTIAERAGAANVRDDKAVKPESGLRSEKDISIDGAVRPEAVKTVAAVIDKAAATPLAPAPTTAPDSLNEVLEAALKDLSPADPRHEISTDELLRGLSKAKAAVSAPEAPRLADKLDALSPPLPSGERSSATIVDSAQQTASSPKLELHHQQPHAGALDAARQVIAAIRTDAKGNGIEVRLDPPDLGRVRIHFAMDRADSVTAVVTADRGDTLDTMRRHAGDLARELSRAGFTNVNLEFKSGGDRSLAGNPDRSLNSSALALDETAGDPAPFLYARARLEGRLDRLV